MHIHLNPLGGLAGDMFCAAILDAYPQLLSALELALAGLAMPVPVQIDLVENRGVLRGKRFSVRPGSSGHAHHHTSLRDIEGILADSNLADEVKGRARGIFRLLAEAEGEVHGVSPEDVTFHEVGGWDSITDIVGAAFLIEHLNVESASSGPLPLGGGRVKSAHGVLPVPAPATAILMRGQMLIDDGIGGERVTPTGAAILKSLAPKAGPDAGAILHATGTGFGSRRLEGVPNCLQILFLERQPVDAGAETAQHFDVESDRIVSIRFDVDDQSPEDFAAALDHIRARDGVLSVCTSNSVGKSGRPTMGVEILARPGSLAGVAEACFRETTTIGLRWQEQNRLLLPRRQATVDTGDRTLGVKIVQRPQGSSAKVESRDLLDVESHTARDRLRQAGAMAALDIEVEHE